MEIKTDHLIIKVLDEDSSNMIANFYISNEGYFERFEPTFRMNMYDEDTHKKILRNERKALSSRSAIRFYLFEKSGTHKVIGTVSYRVYKKNRVARAVVGYKIDREYQRRGYCREALIATFKYMHSDWGIDYFDALVLPDNIPSIRLLEQLGFSSMGYFKDEMEVNHVMREMLRYVKNYKYDA